MNDSELEQVVASCLTTAIELMRQGRIEESVEVVGQAVEMMELAAHPTRH